MGPTATIWLLVFATAPGKKIRRALSIGMTKPFRMSRSCKSFIEPRPSSPDFVVNAPYKMHKMVCHRGRAGAVHSAVHARAEHLFDADQAVDHEDKSNCESDHQHGRCRRRQV